MRENYTLLENFELNYPLENMVPLEKALFFDIETTGFTARSSYLYLIGCAFYSGGNWYIRQWFAENYDDEAAIINAFFTFALDYQYLIHFNGNNFDLPFVTQKCEQLGIPYTFDYFDGIDLYRRISPYRYFLKLPNCKQKTIEQFLGIERQDPFHGGELIGVYHDYVQNPTDFAEKSLLLHNEDDIKGMLKCLPILAYHDLFNSSVKAKKVQASTYRDISGNRRQELIMTIGFNTPLPVEVSTAVGNCYFKGAGNEAQIRVPIYEEEMKYFYANYKDYYYLPAEDIALHKSVSGFVDPEYRVPATASTCYSRKYSQFLPQWSIVIDPFFKRDYKSKELFFELTDELKKNRKAFTDYANHMLAVLAASF